MAIGTTNISIDEVRSVLWASSYDLATLCKYYAINPSAKYKPTRDPEPFNMTDWYKNKSAENYGLGVNCYGLSKPYGWIAQSDLSALASDGFYHGMVRSDEQYSLWNILQSLEFGWTYEHPDTYYRLTDFAGYAHSVKFNKTGQFNVPFYIDRGKVHMTGAYLGTSMTLYAQVSDEGDEGLGFDSLFNRATMSGDMYFGFAIRGTTNTSKTPYLVAMGKVGKNSSDTNFVFDTVDASGGLYWARITAQVKGYIESTDGVTVTEYNSINSNDTSKSVYSFAFLAMAKDSKFYFYSLGAPWVSNNYVTNVPISTGSANTDITFDTPGSVYAAVTVKRITDTIYYFYFNSSTAFSLQGASSSKYLGLQKIEIRAGSGVTENTYHTCAFQGSIYITGGKAVHLQQGSVNLEDTTWNSAEPSNNPALYGTVSGTSGSISVKLYYMNNSKNIITMSASISFGVNVTGLSIGSTVTLNSVGLS